MSGPRHSEEPCFRRDRSAASPTRAGPRGDQPRAGIGRAGHRDHGRAVRDPRHRRRRTDSRAAGRRQPGRSVRDVESQLTREPTVFVPAGCPRTGTVLRAGLAADAHGARAVAQPVGRAVALARALGAARRDARDARDAAGAGRQPRYESGHLERWRRGSRRSTIDAEPAGQAAAGSDAGADPRQKARTEADDVSCLLAWRRGVEGQGVRHEAEQAGARARRGTRSEPACGATGDPPRHAPRDAAGHPPLAARDRRGQAAQPRVAASVAPGSSPALGSRSRARVPVR